VTDDQIQSHPTFAYIGQFDVLRHHRSRLRSLYQTPTGSKIAAEKAAWDFVQNQKPNFTVTTILPVLVFGPVIHDVASIDDINTSAQLVRDLIQGDYKHELPESQLSRWVDVRDTAVAHVRAFEVDGAGDKRFLVAGGTFSNREVATILWNHFPALRPNLPGPEVKSGGYPAAGVAKVDNEPSRKILGMEYMSLEESIVSMAGSLVGLYKP
jgi:nucleoside-diphosphate-sugar epimerase